MRRSNWLTLALAFLISVILIGAWFGAGLDKVDGPVDIIATAIWWAAIITAGVAITLAERTRRMRLRTVFLAPGVLYNPEVGFVLVPENQSPVILLQKLLDRLEYRAPKEGPTDRLHPRFTHIIRTYKYSKGAKVWQGEVSRAARPDQTKRFDNREELIEILAMGKLSGRDRTGVPSSSARSRTRQNAAAAERPGTAGLGEAK